MGFVDLTNQNQACVWEAVTMVTSNVHAMTTVLSNTSDLDWSNNTESLLLTNLEPQQYLPMPCKRS